MAQSRSITRKIVRWTLIAVFAVVLLGLSAWAVAALYIDVRIAWLRVPLAVLYVVAVLALAIWFKFKWRAAAAVLGAFVLVLVWWLNLRPSNDRDWMPDVAVTPYAEIAGDDVRVHNIRNCEYRTETDYDVRHYDKRFDLSKLRTVDLYLVRWGSPLIAHTMLSFGFEDGDYLCVSIETRMERGEAYSAIRGFFRQFELTYVIADERDVVRLRTNYRKGEEVFLYRTRTTPEGARKLLLDYLKHANALHERAEWYNALTDNCTTNIRFHVDAVRGWRSAFDWRILLNGGADEMLAENGRFASDLPIAELRTRCHINERARQADDASDFSKQIRKDLPGVGGE